MNGVSSRSSHRYWRRRRARAGLGVTAVLVAASLVVPAGPAYANPTTVLRGIVLAPDGSPLPGATVTITALRGLDGPEIGESYQDAPLATTTSGPDGRYVLPLIANPDVVSHAAANGGYANFAVLTFKNTDRDTSVSTPPNGTFYSAADFVYLAVDANGTLEYVTGEAGEGYSAVDVVTLETEAGSIAGSATSGGVGDSSGSCRYGPTVTVVERSTPWEPVAQVHTGWDTTLRIDYGRHANTDLGGAYKTGSGPFKASAGTSHMGNESSIVNAGYGAYRGTSVLTKFRYAKEKIEFRDAYTGNVCWTDYRIRAEGWAGHSVMSGMDRYNESTWDGLIQADRNGNLGEFPADSGWTKKTGRGRKYTSEVSAFGVGLSAQGTYSAQIDVFYKFGLGTSRMHYIYHPTRDLESAPAVYAW